MAEDFAYRFPLWTIEDPSELRALLRTAKTRGCTIVRLDPPPTDEPGPINITIDDFLDAVG